MTEQWRELKETVTEMRDNDGTGTQQDVCKFLVNYMEILEKQMQDLQTKQCKNCKYFRKLPYHADALGKCIHHTGFCPKGDWYCADFEIVEL